MIVRAEDFANKNIFLDLAESAQGRGLIPAGPLNWDEGDSIVDLNDLDIEVSVTGIVGANGKVKKY